MEYWAPRKKFHWLAALCLPVLVTFLFSFTLSSGEIEVIRQWNLLPFNLPDDFPIENYTPENNAPTGLEVSWNRIFLAVPRLRVGVPATLAWIPRNRGGKRTSPNLQAYPSWEYHRSAVGDFNCSGLISVYRIRADRCNRLWVLDSGVYNSIDNFTTVCPPKILLFDLRTDQLLKTISFPREVITPISLFTNLAIDDLSGSGSCDNAFVYITDTASPGLVVYDASKDVAWRFSHPSMFPNPDFSSYNVAGETFILTDGILGLTLSPSSKTTERILYYQPLATDRIFSITTSVLQSRPTNQFPVKTVGRKSSQGVGLAVNQKDGSIYFSPLSETAIASWTPGGNRQKVLAYSPQMLQFPSDLIIASRDRGNIWLITTRFQKFFLRTINPEEVNLRIIRINITSTSYN